MKADEKPIEHYAKPGEAIEYTSKCGEEIKCTDIDYINQLRYERLMAKAGFFAELKHNGDYLLTMANDNKSWEQLELQLMRISRTCEARARKIKEGM